MNISLPKIIITICIIILSLSCAAQVCEWRLNNTTYSNTDPDGIGPATGSVTFTLQIHTTGATINNVNVLATGWSYQSTAAMIPNPPACVVGSNPANVAVSAPFTTGGFTYTTVNECAVFSQTTGGQTFDRTVAGSLDGAGINLTSTWTDVFTATLWTLGITAPEGGYVIINSSSIGSPGPLPTYSVSDNLANEFPANSLTFSTPLALGSAVLPVLFTKFDAACTDNGTLVSWSTGSESNSNYFELQRSSDGSNWTTIATVKAASLASTGQAYKKLDAFGGKAYYRIKQVDIDGHFMYSTVTRTSCEQKAIYMVIYPVPATDVLNVIVQSDKALKTDLVLVDAIGKIIRKTGATLFNGSNTFLFDLKGLPAGAYLIRIKKFTIAR
jgi:hypothetical protein